MKKKEGKEKKKKRKEGRKEGRKKRCVAAVNHDDLSEE